MALSAFKRAVSLAPEWVVPRRNLGVALSEAGETSQALQEFRAAIDLAPEEPQTFSNFLLCLNYLENLGCSEIIKAHRTYGERFAVKETSPFANPCQRNRTLRVGFVSGDLRDHSVSWFFEPLLESLAGSNLECVCISSAPVSGPVTDRLKLLAAGWIDIFAHPDESAERMIRDAGIDVLIDLSGHTAANRLALFARRPAPVQMTMIGYLQTTGLRTMDYRISDAWLDPDQREGAEENHAPEQLIRLRSGAFGFRLPADAPEVGPLPASSAASSQVLFASLNNLTKLQPKVIEAWARILSSVEGSRLLVLGSDSERLLRGLAQHGVGPERVVHHQRMPLPEFYKMLSGVHIALDTFPFNGLTVNLLAAWMGVPTLTLRGSTPHGRAGSAVAERLGHPELVAESPEDYVGNAVRLARDPEALGRIRFGLRERVRLGFGDHATHAEQFRQAVRGAWERWCEAQN
jgi:predicted O-linked N-acetylglucosamine transferase (SPINDLY family)